MDASWWGIASATKLRAGTRFRGEAAIRAAEPHKKRQIGDLAWLCDVYVDRAHRGTGAGSFMVDARYAPPDVGRLETGKVLPISAGVSPANIATGRSRRSVAAEPHN